MDPLAGLEGMALIKAALLQLFTEDPVNWVKWGAVFLVLILGYVITLPIYSKVSYRLSWERKRDIARSRGHVVEAHLDTYFKDRKTPDDDGKFRDRRSRSEFTCHAVYTYQLDGRERTYKALFKQNSPPVILYLYYLKNPRRLFSVEEFHYENHKALIIGPVVFLPWILALVTFWLLQPGTYL